MSKILEFSISYKTKEGEGTIPHIDVSDLDPEEIQSLMDGAVDEILKEQGLIEVGRND